MNAVAIVPAFNEARSIADVVTGLQGIVSHVLIVDDGSTDQTAARARAAGAEVLRRDTNNGIVFTDAAGEHERVETAKHGDAAAAVSDEAAAPPPSVILSEVDGRA